MRGLRRAVVLLAVLVAAAGAGTAASSRAVVSPCLGRQLTGTFAVVRGSAGAGNISYDLRLRNRSTRTCFVSGLPSLQLLGKTGARLPTHVRAANRGALTAVRVLLKPGGYTAATARFSPDVPGTGEPGYGQCEPTAYTARVTAPPGSGTVVVAIVPPTPVCEHGTMTLSALVAGRRGPNG